MEWDESFETKKRDLSHLFLGILLGQRLPRSTINLNGGLIGGCTIIQYLNCRLIIAINVDLYNVYMWLKTIFLSAV